MRARISPRPHLPRLHLIALALSALAVLFLGACDGGDEDAQSGIDISTSTSGETVTATATRTPTPPPTPLPVPAAPDDPFAGARLVEDYLVRGEPDMENCLPALVEQWAMAPSTNGPRCFVANVDADEREEFLFLVSFAADAEDTSPYPADLWLFDDAEAGHAFFASARELAESDTPGLRVRNVADLTGDGRPEVVLTWLECGASTCITHLLIASDHNGALEDLAPDDASLETVENFEVTDGVISMSGGIIGSVGAGPQRTTTRNVSWVGGHFRTESIQGPPTYLVHLVNDADALFAAGAYADAQQAYQDVIANVTLPDWKAEIGEAPGRIELQAYSSFRAALSALRQESLLEAGRLLERTASQYSQTMHGSAAIQYLTALSRGQSPTQACAAAENVLMTIEGQYAAFWNFGYANPERSILTLCR